MGHLIKKSAEEVDYVNILKTDASKLEELKTVIEKRADSWALNQKDKWEFNYEKDDSFPTLTGPSSDEEYEKFVTSLEDDGTFEEFFNADISDEDLKKIGDYVYEQEFGYSEVEGVINDAKEEFEDNYDPNPNPDNHPWGPGMSQKDFL